MDDRAEALEIWRKIEQSVEANRRLDPGGVRAPNSDGAAEGKADAKRLRRVRRALDFGGILLWSYFVLKIFVVDVDRVVIERVAPGAVGALNYRFFAWLLLAALVIASRRRRVYLGALYVLAFPFIVLFWKIPVFFVRRKSWTLLLASLNALFAVFSDFRYNFLSKTLGILAALAILAGAHQVLLALAAAYLAALLVLSIGRTIRRSFHPSPFLRVQRKRISSMLSSSRVREAYAIPKELRNDQIEIYTPEEVGKFALSLSLAVGINHGLYFWAYQLERYRRTSSMPLLLSGFAYVWLFLGTTLGLALINYAVLQISPSEYSFGERPSFVAVTLYSLSSLALSDGGGLSASGDIAFALGIFGGIAGVVFLASFVLNLAVASRRERDETAMRETIADLKERAREQEERLYAEYAVGVEEARKRLESVGSAFGQWLGYLTASIPDDFLRQEPRERGSDGDEPSR